MGVVVFCSGKSAGVTTLALVVAARWPQPAAALLVEADPAGGDLAARFGLRPAPGLTSAAAAAGTSGQDPRLAGGHAQQLPGVGVAVLLAAASYLQASAAVRTADEASLIDAAGQAGPVVVDAGRLHGGSPALPIVARADVAVVLTRPRWDELAHAAATVAALRSAGGVRPWLVLRGDGPVAAKEIVEALGAPVWGAVPEDRTGARVLCGQARPGRGWVRLPLARTGHGLAIALARELPQPIRAGDEAGARS